MLAPHCPVMVLCIAASLRPCRDHFLLPLTHSPSVSTLLPILALLQQAALCQSPWPFSVRASSKYSPDWTWTPGLAGEGQLLLFYGEHQYLSRPGSRLFLVENLNILFFFLGEMLFLNTIPLLFWLLEGFASVPVKFLLLDLGWQVLPFSLFGSGLRCPGKSCCKHDSGNLPVIFCIALLCAGHKDRHWKTEELERVSYLKELEWPFCFT